MLPAVRVCKNLLSKSLEKSVTIVRHETVKANETGRRVRQHAPGQNRRLLTRDGDYVSRGTLLTTQRPRFWFDDNNPRTDTLPLRFHPGQYAGIGRNHTVYALEAGRVVITAEEFQPKWDHKIVSKQYAGRENQKILRHYLHVIPDPLPQTFKLIDEV